MPRYNEHGGLIIRQSDLASYARCPQQKKLSDDLQAAGLRERTLSATVYGTVVHHALQVGEEARHGGLPHEDALALALATFEHYWLPENVGDLEPGGIDHWLPRQTWGGLNAKGKAVLALYFDMLKDDPGQLLALEYNFSVPLLIEGRLHTFTGTVDRMSRRLVTTPRRGPVLELEDYKTGKVPLYLRHHMQFTGYSWASTQRAFWDGFDDPEDAFTKTQDWPRRAIWVDMATVKRKKAGPRNEQDYARFHVAMAEYIKAVEADVYPLSIKGDVCTYCPFADTKGAPGQCGGVPVADEDER